MKTCPTCQSTYPDDYSLCPRDGAKLTVQATEAEAQFAAGLSRRFHIVRQLGQGGMGTVFLAEQLAVGNRHVALKVLNRKLLDDPDFFLRFQNEAGSTGRIHHPNVVTVFESGQGDDGTPYIAMEFLEGESLRDVLSQGGALPVTEVALILLQAAKGLNAAHKLGIVHRDLKPDNIFLTHDDEGELVVKVVDFGIAKLRDSGAHTMTGVVLGTPAYMSYEQASGMRSAEVDARSDIYSMGVVVYEMLTGRLPFLSDTPVGYLRKHLLENPPPFDVVAHGIEIPLPVEAVVLKALKKERDERHQSALEFAHTFRAASLPSSKSEISQLLPATMVNQPLEQARNETKCVVRVNPKDGLNFVWIPPGTFFMGCSHSDTECFDHEKPSHQVTITKGFWMGQTEVTVRAFKRFTIATGREMPREPDFAGRALNPEWGNEAMPIVNVTWEDAQAYCFWAGGRLPSEAEWEYAARAGSTASRYGNLDEIAWYVDNSWRDRMVAENIWEDLPNSILLTDEYKALYEQLTKEDNTGMHEVGQKRANGFGLYDMLGNVGEWVNDWYDEKYYQRSPSQDPMGPPNGEYRVIRGGSWKGSPNYIRVSCRQGLNYPTNFLPVVGFRCVGEIFAN